LLLDDANLVPGKDKLLSVVAWIDGAQTVIFHGPITGRKVDLKHGGSGSVLELSATDRRVELDRQCQNCDSHSGTVDIIVGKLLKPLACAKLEVESFSKVRYQADSSPLNQTESNLATLKKLGALVNAEFWLDWKLAGTRIVETAHFASQPKRNDSAAGGFSYVLPIDQAKKPSLKMNTGDAKSTLLSFSSDRKSEVPQQSGKISRIDPRTGEIKSSQVMAPSTKPLGVSAPKQAITSSVLSAGGIESARTKAEAALNDASWIVEAQAETSAFALQSLLRPRFIVDVSGTGVPDDGEYLVWSVEHQITPLEHRMKLSLKRNAVGGK
jgi:hypothetical protein